MKDKKYQPVPHKQAPRVYQKPEDLFRAEKDRSTSAARSHHAKLLAEAKAAFDKLMAEGQAARKSGRPRKHPLPPLKTGAAAGRGGPVLSYIRPSDVALGLVQLPITPESRVGGIPLAPAKPAPKPKSAKAAKPKAKVKAKAKAKPKAKPKKAKKKKK